MPQASPNPKRGQQPGKFQRPMPRLAGFRRTTMDDPDITLWWEEDGWLYSDEELTVRTGLAIVELYE
jgi:hypothetical protein